MARPNDSRLVYSTGGDKPKDEPAPEASSAGTPGIRLRLERRAGNRVATVVTGLPGTAGEASALAKLLKATCSTGGAFKEGILELQGDHRENVEKALVARGLKSKRAGG
jgi:translation initiation factor 1